MSPEKIIDDLQSEIKDLKQQLHLSRCSAFDEDPVNPPDTKLNSYLNDDSSKSPPTAKPSIQVILTDYSTSDKADLSLLATHPLLLLSDSALPLGSFAYSSGLESYLAHTKSQPNHNTSTSGEQFYNFLTLSIASIASTTLPYLLKAHRFPDLLEELDNDLDASTPCTVARRASVAQGLALLGVWERAYRKSYTGAAAPRGGRETDITPAARGAAALDAFSESLKQDPDDAELGCSSNGHMAPLWGVVCVAMSIEVKEAAYVFILNHAKAVLSAAVRASVMGPYQAQAVLASKGLQTMIVQRLQKEWKTEPEDAGQNVPVLDLWVGRHELLYSRIFNS